MSVMIVTSLGDIVVDLYIDRCPLTTKNFLKLCKIKYYNGCLFHTVEKDFIAQTGDPTGTGSGGESVYKFLYGDQARFFEDEIHPDLKHSKIGTVAMAGAGENCNASQFYITLRDGIEYLDGKHTIFGIVEEKESLDTLAKINEAYVDVKGRPFKDIRIKHTYILEDTFDDPPQLAQFVPEKSPEGKPPEEVAEGRLEDSWVPMDERLSAEELDEVIRSRDAQTNAAILESIGDIPDAEIKPPDNVLFVCKLNPVTQDEDLHTIFSRFGAVTSADIIRDYKTGDSLCYAFIEFDTKEACERAYFKMDNTLIDDRRIHVDFSQSVAKLWKQFRHGTRSTKDGCFKCGASDHIARDCGEGLDVKQKGSKYVLRDTNTQHGGDVHKSYDMLFDEETLERTEQNEAKKMKMNHNSLDDPRYDERGLRVSSRHRNDDERSRRQRDDQKERAGGSNDRSLDGRLRERSSDGKDKTGGRDNRCHSEHRSERNVREQVGRHENGKQDSDEGDHRTSRSSRGGSDVDSIGRHRKDDGSHAKRKEEEEYRRDYRSHVRSRDEENEAYRKRSHGDGRK